MSAEVGPQAGRESAKIGGAPSLRVGPPAPSEDRKPEPFPRIGTVEAWVNPSPPLSALGLLASAQAGEGDYFTRDQLSVGPYPTGMVAIDYPPVESQEGNHVSELSLFIDEVGRVVRVRVDGPRLPEALEDAARTAFMSAQFSPGMVDGLPVRSRIRIEVSFLTTHLPR